ncbi:hypothetical protein CORC01_05003 [Colletotrichum orchidophilum]|uniref:Cyanovirin-N domain-containing protein n=1 Tax=Colletotrichum orchidophilum TaxID=1209926 RepID=A0A1G4BE92_9PEZI|nr:uncharacterized protein CORC01_05003 [Colletotrichum orchidophilum]OHE99645.1 hypothetical protein CORC01_05003 [Colletotrichum orchidophilum]
MKSSIIIAFLSICLFTTHIAALDRECPLESDCMQKLCKNFNYIGGKEWDPFYLVADCKNNRGTYVHTKLNLKNCIANWDGRLEWTPRGGFQCGDCGVFHNSPDAFVGLRCEECKPLRFFPEGYKWSYINLSQGIWVNKDGALSCYDMTGEWHN